MCYVSCITVSWNLHHITNIKTYLYNTNNKTNKQQDLPLQRKQQDIPLQQNKRLTFTTQTTRQTNNKTHEHQDKENDTKTSTHKTKKLETTTSTQSKRTLTWTVKISLITRSASLNKNYDLHQS